MWVPGPSCGDRVASAWHSVQPVLQQLHVVGGYKKGSHLFCTPAVRKESKDCNCQLYWCRNLGSLDSKCPGMGEVYALRPSLQKQQPLLVVWPVCMVCPTRCLTKLN